MHKPIAATVYQFDETERWATRDYAKNTAMLFYATNMHLHDLAKDPAPRRIWHIEKSTELLACIAAKAPAQNKYNAGIPPKHENPFANTELLVAFCPSTHEKIV